MIKPVADATYLIELCSGEQRRWRFLGQDRQGAAWWRDLETSMEFNEGSLMYAWSIVERLDANDPAGPEQSEEGTGFRRSP